MKIWFLFCSIFCIMVNPLYTQNWKNYISGGKFITALAEDADCVWIGTDIGLFKIDKITHETSLFDKTSGLPANYATAVAIDNNGNKWVGFEGAGIGKFDNNNWEYFNTSNSPLPSNHVQFMYADKKGNIWIACDSNLVLYRGGNWNIFKSKNSSLPAGKLVTSITEDNSSLWVSTQGGLVNFNGTDWTIFDTTNSDIPSNYINTIAIDSNNNKWLGLDKGVAMFDDFSWTYFYENTPLVEAGVLSISIDKQGVFWIGTWRSLLKFDLARWIEYADYNSELPGPTVNIIITDSLNNKWIGTNEFGYNFRGGLVTFDGIDNWEYIVTSKTELPSKDINFVREDSDKNIWVGSNHGVSKRTKSNWDTYFLDESFLSPKYVSLGTDNSGSLLLSARIDWYHGDPGGSEIYKFDGQQFSPYSSLFNHYIYDSEFSFDENVLWCASSLGPSKFDGNVWTVDTINGLYMTNAVEIQGDIKWFATDKGLLKFYDRNNWQIYDVANSPLPDNKVNNVNVDNSGVVWIPTANGLAKLDDDNWDIYNTDNSGLLVNNISCVGFDQNNFIWVTTMGGGVAKFDGNNWIVFNSSNSPLVSDNIKGVYVDVNNNKWFYSETSGISVFNENGITDVEKIENIYPNDFLLLQNYPNPFNPETNIKYSVPHSGMVKIKLFDILGNELKTLVNEEVSAGSHNIKVNAAGLASGIYFYKMEFENSFKTGKMLLLK